MPAISPTDVDFWVFFCYADRQDYNVIIHFQEKQLKTFREMLKQDQKRLKKEIEKLPKATKKEEMRVRKEKLDLHQQNQVSIISSISSY